jgi:pimeloyl-ACP methyl ester carboxylesterase
MDSYTHDGLTFDVSDTGPTDGRVVVALHGFPEDRHCWDQIAAGLAGEGFRVLAPDQRGYSPGARPPGRRAYVTSNLSSDVIALADGVGADRFDVVGHDWGGLVAWDLAARRPDRVRTLTSLSTPHPRAVRDVMMNSTQALHSWYMLFFQIPALPEWLFATRGGRDMRARLVRDGLGRETADRYAKRFAVPGAMTGPINWYRAIPLSAREPTPRVSVPTMYVWSDGDRYLTRQAAEATSRHVTGPYRFEVLVGGSHWLPTEAAAQVLPPILEHLKSVPA